MTEPHVVSIGPEDILEIYGQWCEERDRNLQEGAVSVPIPVADTYIIRLLFAFKKIPGVLIEVHGKH